MAKKERQKRAARKARQKERAEREALAAAQGKEGSGKDSKKAPATSGDDKKAKSPKKAKAKKDKKPGLFKRMRNYFAGVKSEMHRVVWPSRGELKNYSVAVIIMLIVFGIVVWAVDTGVLALFAEYTGLRSVLGL